MGEVIADVIALLGGVAVIVWGAETFAEHLASAAARLGVTSFALALLLAGAEPEELATAVAATLRDSPGIAFGDVIGANAAICLVALGVGAVVAPLPFGPRGRRYALFGLPVGAVAVASMWDGRVGRTEGAILVGLYIAYVAAIWIAERRPPALGETAELEEAHEPSRRVGRELLLVLAGLAAMVAGAACSCKESAGSPRPTTPKHDSPSRSSGSPPPSSSSCWRGRRPDAGSPTPSSPLWSAASPTTPP